MKKIVFTGPECSGKTTLSREIAKHFNLIWIEEYARKYLNKLQRSYKYCDLKKIAQGQLQLENRTRKNQILICDTNLQVIKLWSLIKFSKCDPFIINNQDSKALYILCKPDFTWTFDHLRENPENREEIFNLYHQDLIENNMDFIIANGNHNERFQLISRLIHRMSTKYV
tara:strand:+ start:283 stop:792 length:510 start_codon:yes stop_codon:yes gene_type:complete